MSLKVISLQDEHFYKKLLSESQLVEDTLGNFANSLAVSLDKLQIYQLHVKPFATPDMEHIRKQISRMIAHMKEKMARDVEIISSVLGCISQTTDYFHRLIEVRQEEIQRSQQEISKLDRQVKSLDKQIGQCEKQVQRSKQLKEIDEWKREYYIKDQMQHFPLIEANGQDYLKIIQDLKRKMIYKMETEKKQHGFIRSKIDKKLLDFKVRLTSAWMLLSRTDNNLISTIQFKKDDSPLQKSFYHEVSQFERKYVDKERQIDEFEQSKLHYIKRQLRFLQEINMSESRQNLSYSPSQQFQEESFVV